MLEAAFKNVIGSILFTPAHVGTDLKSVSIEFTLALRKAARHFASANRSVACVSVQTRPGRSGKLQETPFFFLKTSPLVLAAAA